MAVYNLELAKTIPMENVVLRPWQQDLMDILNGPVNPRHIHWIWEDVGNIGKSFMASYLARNHGALVISNGKTADIAYLMKKDYRIVVWDLARCTDFDKINYGAMEDIKNCRIFSAKYQSVVKHFECPHIVVFANAPPPHGKFSADRLQVNNIGATSGDRDHISAFAPGFQPPLQRQRTFQTEFNFDSFIM